jgi:hypothetical protein
MPPITSGNFNDTRSLNLSAGPRYGKQPAEEQEQGEGKGQACRAAQDFSPRTSRIQTKELEGYGAVYFV